MKLHSERVVIEAPLSFSGSAKRIWRMTRNKGSAAKFALGVLAATLIALVWCFVLMWYLIFGLLVVPYRLIRRSGRKQKRDRLRHREMMEELHHRP